MLTFHSLILEHFFLFHTSSAFFFHSVHLLVLYLQPGSICTQIFNTLHSLPLTHTLHWEGEGSTTYSRIMESLANICHIHQTGKRTQKLQKDLTGSTPLPLPLFFPPSSSLLPLPLAQQTKTQLKI